MEAHLHVKYTSGIAPELLTENGYRELLVVDLRHSETLPGNSNKLLAGASQQSVFALLKLEVCLVAT